MVTLFTTPKPFTGKFNTIQRNAIKSWTLINPGPEIILIGKTEGSDAAAKEFGLRYIPDVSCNEFGTPFVNSIFETARANAGRNLACYINSDTILTDSFIKGIQKISGSVQNNKFVIVGRRWNLFLDRPWNFNKGDWQEGLIKYRGFNGFLDNAGKIDFFVFPKNIEWHIPPFAIGRGSWNGWFIYNAIKLNIPVIDTTDFITVYHQKHDNFYLDNKKRNQMDAEFKKNKKLLGSFTKQYTVMDSSHMLTFQGLKKSSVVRRLLAIILRIKLNFLYYLYILHLD